MVYAKDKTELTRWMIDRYRCSPKNSNWTDKKMTDQYRYNPENLNTYWQDQWQIDIGTVPKNSNRTELIGRWPIDIGAVPTWTEHKLTWKWSINIGVILKNSNWTDKKMIDIYKHDPKNINPNWQEDDRSI